MLKILRKKGVAKKILWTIAIVIIISFGFFGTANYLGGPTSADHAGKIHGRKVSLDDFEEAYQHTRLQAMMRYGENFFKVSQFLDLEKETWDRLILLHEAKKRNLKVTDQEVVEAIRNFPFFQRNGQYDSFLYNDVVRYVFKTQPREFEEGIRESLKLTKLFQQETFLVTVTPEEVFEAYTSKNEKVKVSYVWFPAEKFKDQVSVDESNAQAFYEAHREEFILPNSINVDYFSVEFPVQVSESEKARITAQTQEIYQDIRASDWESAAQKYGLTIHSTGFFSLEQPDLKLNWPYEVLLKAFALAEGQTSEMIETAKGIYILKLKEKRESYVPEFAEVKERIKGMMLLEKAGSIAKTRAQEARQEIQEQLSDPSADFTRLAKAAGFEVDQTPLFARGDYLPKIGISKAFQETAFSLEEGQKLSDVVEIGKGYGFLYLEQHEPAGEAEFEKEKDKLAEELLTELKNEAFNEFLTRLRLKANLVDNISTQKQDRN